MTAYDVYAAVVADPELRCTGEPEEWRDNVELLFEIGAGLSAMSLVWDLAREEGRGGGRADWATWIAHVTLDELRELVAESSALAARVDGLEPGPQYAVVAVEGV